MRPGDEKWFGLSGSRAGHGAKAQTTYFVVPFGVNNLKSPQHVLGTRVISDNVLGHVFCQNRLSETHADKQHGSLGCHSFRVDFKDFKLHRPAVVFQGRFSEGSSHHLKRVTFWKDGRWPFPKNLTQASLGFHRKKRNGFVCFQFFWGGGMERGMGEVSKTVQLASISRSKRSWIAGGWP